MLVALDRAELRTPARIALRERSYHCPQCLHDVTVKQGKVKVAHFAHKPDEHSCPNAGESLRHLLLKERLYDLLIPHCERCELEWMLPGLRADILARMASKLIAFEIQVSALPLEEMQEKMRRYTALRVACIYVVDGDAIKVNADGEFRCPKWIRALHALYYGRVYAFTPSCSTIGQVHFIRAERWVEDAHNSDGDEVGGYSKSLRTIKEPLYGPPVDVSQIRTMLSSSSQYQPFSGRFLLGHFKTQRFWSTDSEVR